MRGWLDRSHEKRGWSLHRLHGGRCPTNKLRAVSIFAKCISVVCLTNDATSLVFCQRDGRFDAPESRESCFDFAWTSAKRCLLLCFTHLSFDLIWAYCSVEQQLGGMVMLCHLNATLRVQNSKGNGQIRQNCHESEHEAVCTWHGIAMVELRRMRP